MADERTDEMTSSAIEHEIAQALAVEPSPEFLARIRMRVANEPPPRRAWATWTPVLVGATAIAAAVTIAIVAPWRGAQVRLKPDTTAGLDDVRLKPDATTDLDAKSVASALRRTKASQALPVRLKPDTTTEPEVLISRGESAAFRRLVARAREGREDLTALLKEESDVGTDLKPPQIDIPLIKVEPLVPQTGGEGVPQ